jgi:hypothetical protein
MKIKFVPPVMALALLVMSASLLQVHSVRADTPLAGAPAKKKLPFPQYVHARVQANLDLLKNGGDYAEAIKSLQDLLDQAILYSPADRPEAIREADFALRLVTQLKQAPGEKREELLTFLRKHDNLAQTLVFLVREDRQRTRAMYDLLDELRQKRGEQLDKYATLTAAICVVHNTTRSIHANENTATSPPPVDIFDYYVKNESRMFFGIKDVPAELLIYVVDTTASISEMEWALNKYGGNPTVGKLFFTIKYDYDYLKSGGQKKLTAEGFSLQNIARYGGVCVDQSYFATTVGKAIGIPTTMDEGESGSAGHAWVGYLQFANNHAWWNFDEGRYQSYQGVQGNVSDPQLRQNIPDSYVSLLGEMIGTKAVDRQTTVALTDAAARLRVLEEEQTTVAAPPVDDVTSPSISAKPRARDTAAQLAMIESALHFSVAYTPTWFAVRDLAVANKLTLNDKRHWSDLLLRLGAKKYPDFTLSVLMPMVQTISDPKEEDSLLTAILPLFAARKDLSASIQMKQAALYQEQKQDDRALNSYADIIQRYSNDGPFVLAALAGAEKMLAARNRSEQIPLMYGQAWGLTKKPGDWSPDFLAESNWFRIGKLYAQKLAKAGDAVKAAQVESTLGVKK